MKNKMTALMTIAMAATALGAMSMAHADEVDSSQVPANLQSAETIDAAIQAKMGDAAADESSFDEAFGGRGGAPGGFRPAPMPRPIVRPVVRPVVRPGFPVFRPGFPYRPFAPRPIFVARPIPYYGAPIVTCYAQSPANGLTYNGTAYFAADAEQIALDTCFNIAGYECVSQGCN